MMYDAEMASCVKIHLTSYVKISAGVQAKLIFASANLNGCNVGITD
jgi:hypothetical protein